MRILAAPSLLAVLLAAWAPASFGCLSFCTGTTSGAPSTASLLFALTRGSFKISENEAPKPADRLFFHYDPFGLEPPSPRLPFQEARQTRILNWAAIVDEVADFERNIAANRAAEGDGAIDFSKIKITVQPRSFTQGEKGQEEARQITASRALADGAAKPGAVPPAANPPANTGNEGQERESILKSVAEPTPDELRQFYAEQAARARAARAAADKEERDLDQKAQDVANALFSGDESKAKAAGSIFGYAPKDLQNRIARKINEKVQQIVNDAMRASTSAAAGAPRIN